MILLHSDLLQFAGAPIGGIKQVITWTPKTSTIDSNEEQKWLSKWKYVILSLHVLLHKFFVWIFVFRGGGGAGEKSYFLISETDIRKKKNKKFTERLFYWLESSIQRFRAIYPQITELKPIKIFDYSKYI